MAITVSKRSACVGLSAALFAAIPFPAQADQPLHDGLNLPDELILRGSMRARIEGIEGQFRPASPADDLFLSFRTIVFAEYDSGPIRIGGELRDARGYLQRRTSTIKTSEINALEPVQAYIAADLPGLLGKNSLTTLAAGRFTMEIGSSRLVAAPDFPNGVQTYTGAKFEWRSAAKDRLIAFWTMPVTRLPYDERGLRDNRVELDRSRTAQQFEGASFTRAHFGAGASGEVYLYNLDERDSTGQPTRDRHIVTYGARLFRAPAKGAVDAELEAARQTGTARASTAATDRTDLLVAAGFIHAEIGRTWPAPWAPRVSIHGDYASGDDADPRRYARLDPLFGAPRADFGPTILYGAVNRSNLISGGVRIDVVPGKRLDGFVMARDLWLATATDSFASTGVRDPSGRSGRHAGEQVEARVRYWIAPQRLRMEGGGAYLAKGHFLRAAPNAPKTGDTRYAYLALTGSF